MICMSPPIAEQSSFTYGTTRSPAHNRNRLLLYSGSTKVTPAHCLRQVVVSRPFVGKHRLFKLVGSAFRNCPVAAILYLGSSAIRSLLQSTANLWPRFVYRYDRCHFSLAKSEYSIRITTPRKAALRTTGSSDSPTGTESSPLEVGLSIERG